VENLAVFFPFKVLQRMLPGRKVHSHIMMPKFLNMEIIRLGFSPQGTSFPVIHIKSVVGECSLLHLKPVF